MYGIHFSITHKFERRQDKHSMVFVSYAGVGGIINRADDDFTATSNSIIVNLRLNIANLNTLVLNADSCASGFDKKIILALQEERDNQLRSLVLCNSNKSLSVDGLRFYEERHNGIEDICDMDVHSAEISGLTVKVVFSQRELSELSQREELFSDILALIIEYPESTYADKFKGKTGAFRALETQRALRVEEMRKRNETFAANGNVYNYFLNDPERRVGTLYVNHLGTVRKIKAVALSYTKKGLYLSLGENEEYEEKILDIDEVLNGDSIPLGVYLTEAQAKAGTNNSEETTRLSKELDKTQAFLKDKVKDIIRVTERAIKAEDALAVKEGDLKLLKHELNIKELLLKEREQGIKTKEDIYKLKDAEQKHKEQHDQSLFGKAKRFFSGIFDIGRSIFGFMDGAAKARIGAKVLGIL